MFSHDRILSHINYAELSSTCQGGMACLKLAEAVGASIDSDSDKETEIIESSVMYINLKIKAN